MIFLAFTSFIRKFAARNHTNDGRYNEISECGGDGWEAFSSVATDEIQSLSANSSVITDEFTKINTISAVTTAEIPSDDEIRQLQLANYVESSMKEERE